MDGATLGIIAPLVGTAIAAMFWTLIKTKDEQIRDLKDEKADLVAKVEKLQNVVSKNTDALGRNAESQEALVVMLRDLLGDPLPNSIEKRPR